MIAVRVSQILLAAAALGLLISAWVIGRRSTKTVDEKQPRGRQAATILLRIQTLIPLPLFAWDNLASVDPMQHRFPLDPGRIIFSLALLGEVLTVPIVWMWVRYGQDKQRVIGVLTSVLCALFIILLVMVAVATA